MVVRVVVVWMAKKAAAPTIIIITTITAMIIIREIPRVRMSPKTTLSDIYFLGLKIGGILYHYPESS